jgi:hypothetical protein
LVISSLVTSKMVGKMGSFFMLVLMVQGSLLELPLDLSIFVSLSIPMHV